jgi:hypothetical protein
VTKSALQRPDVETELGFLKDFQRRSLDAVFKRLYLDEVPSRRFLLADEVGLGKTLVARGLITRVIDHLWDTVERIDIVYLCSNSDIARQNVSRLTPRGIEGVSLASRITLLPLVAHGLKERKINVVALTPGTSLNLKGNWGIKRERALLLHMLLDHWQLNFTGACRLFRGPATLAPFKVQVRTFGDDETVDDALQTRFLNELDASCASASARGQEPLRNRLERLIAAFREANPPRETQVEGKEIVGELRHALAKSCINALEPDLIILDEFQRFRELLQGDGPAGEMAKQLFEYEDETVKARVLLLSATPYKMLTNTDNAEGEDHYKDFVRTVRFLLLENLEEADRLAILLASFRRDMFRIGQGENEVLESTRTEIETILRRVIVRTERLASTSDRNGMLAEQTATGIELTANDARSYVNVQRVARLIEHSDTLEYWKASPWLLNFMDQYKLGDDVGNIIAEEKPTREFRRAMAAATDSLLPWPDVEAFRRLDPAHARLRWLIRHSLDDGLWKVLWLPPALSYYELGEPFSSIAVKSPTKALLFSAWRVVPRVVAATLSHEAERRMYVALEGEKTNLTGSPERHGDQLKVGRKGSRATGLTMLALLYPSFWLARVCDPMRSAAALHEKNGRVPTLEEVLAQTEVLIQQALSRVTAGEPTRSTPDESWYWAAPILLDRLADEQSTVEWMERAAVEALWAFKSDRAAPLRAEDDDEADSALGDDEDEEVDDDSALGQLMKEALATARGEYVPRGMPPKDLLRVMALIALGGPATVALRSLHHVVEDVDCDNSAARTGAALVGGSFRTLYNQPDSTAIVRATAARSGDYWKQCLEYGASGCLQSVIDEYAHLLVEESGVFGKAADQVVRSISDNMAAAIGIRRAKVGVHYIHSERGSLERESKSIRSRFAMRFGEERADESGDRMRADDVRRAFNSPFWPFVLATTSVGQEGLDFHLYCHKVVHWNLPPNPVDLEQREGRVHRFKGHAVRKNVALKHCDVWRTVLAGDPWQATFASAKQGRDSGDSDLVPFWVYPAEGGASIERHVPMYRLSQDIGRLASLKDALAVYRMVFGQPRQEELMAYLARVVPPEQIDELGARLKISLAP